MCNLFFSFFIFSDAVLRHIAGNGNNSDPKMKLNIEKTTHDGKNMKKNPEKKISEI
jgi:hypothetical protein